VSEILKEGDEILVKVIGIDERGKLNSVARKPSDIPCLRRKNHKRKTSIQSSDSRKNLKEILGGKPDLMAVCFSERMMIQKTTLENGIQVITEEIPHVHSVSVGIWVKAGSRDEEEEENGISHFIEHMLFKGTKRRSAHRLPKRSIP